MFYLDRRRKKNIKIEEYTLIKLMGSEEQEYQEKLAQDNGYSFTFSMKTREK